MDAMQVLLCLVVPAIIGFAAGAMAAAIEVSGWKK